MGLYKGYVIQEIEKLYGKSINNIALDIIRKNDYNTISDFVEELAYKAHIYNKKKRAAYKRVISTYIVKIYGMEFYRNRFNKGNKYLKPIAEYLGVPKHKVIDYIYNQKLIISEITSKVFKNRNTQRFAYAYLYMQLFRHYNANMQLFTTYSKIPVDEMRKAYRAFVEDAKTENPKRMIYV